MQHGDEQTYTPPKQVQGKQAPQLPDQTPAAQSNHCNHCARSTGYARVITTQIPAQFPGRILASKTSTRTSQQSSPVRYNSTRVQYTGTLNQNTTVLTNLPKGDSSSVCAGVDTSNARRNRRFLSQRHSDYRAGEHPPGGISSRVHLVLFFLKRRVAAVKAKGMPTE